MAEAETICAIVSELEYEGTIIKHECSFHHGDDLAGMNVIYAEGVPHKDEDCAWCKALRDRVCSRTSLDNRPK